MGRTAAVDAAQGEVRVMNRLLISCAVLVIVSHFTYAAPTTLPTTAPASQPVASVDPSTRIELSDDPTALFNPSTPIDRFTLHGVALGDDARKIPRRDADENSAGGDASWVRLRKTGDAYLVRGDKVARIEIGDTNLLSRLDVHDEASLLKKFGRPDEVAEVGRVSRNYLYIKRGLAVRWSVRKGTIAGVTIERADRG
jgi:hypothetical protein